MRFRSYGNVDRFFNGIVVDTQWVGTRQDSFAYRLTLRPWLWLLGRRADCRIFKDKTVIDIVEDVFKRAGFNDFELRANRGDYDKIDYCVQYRESDLDFVSRLLEEWGIYTFHEHSESKHQLVLADSRHVIGCEGRRRQDALRTPGRSDRRQCEHVSAWRADRIFRTGSFVTNDFDYMKPAANLKADSSGSERYEKSSFEAYDFPGRYTERNLGTKRAKVRLEAEQALDHRRSAAGDAASLYPAAW